MCVNSLSGIRSGLFSVSKPEADVQQPAVALAVCHRQMFSEQFYAEGQTEILRGFVSEFFTVCGTAAALLNKAVSERAAYGRKSSSSGSHHPLLFSGEGFQPGRYLGFHELFTGFRAEELPPSISDAFILLSKHVPIRRITEASLEKTPIIFGRRFIFWFSLSIELDVQQNRHSPAGSFIAVMLLSKLSLSHFTAFSAMSWQSSMMKPRFLRVSSMLFALNVSSSSALRPAWYFSEALQEIFREKWNRQR